jgi:hypothetical protein
VLCLRCADRSAGRRRGGKDLDTSFRSSALGADLHFDVYLPPGGHEHALWHRDARPWLRLALARLSLSR